MCNIAGYVGERRAAPILIEMLRAQEALNGGFYTGIATMHEGKIYYRKLVGSLSRLLEETDAADLPGNIGIIHSRTPGISGDEWAHPFICERDGEIKTAFVLNGAIGCFNSYNPKRVKLAEELMAEGYTLRSREKKNGKQLNLNDDTHVHPSDVMCQLIGRKIVNGTAADDAMTEAFCETPKEVVALMLSLTEPDAIVWSKMNYPMFLAFADHGAYLATAPQAIPSDMKSEPFLLPLLSSGLIRKDSFTCKPFAEQPAKIAPLSSRLLHDAYEKICEAMRTEPQSFPMLRNIVVPLFDKADCDQANTAIYTVLYDLYRDGRLKIETRYVPGVFEGLLAPATYMSVIE
ncbi:MAG: hypothetical protein IIX69_04700 [Clostridia bacterium]|nr:hypothetical protein [Clostridia bacterium]